MSAGDVFAEYDPVLCAAHGRETCEDLACLPAEPPVSASSGLRFRPALSVLHDPAPVAIIEGLAWAGQLSLLVAESGTGKTFLALRLAAAVSSGEGVADRRCVAGAVAYISFEGDFLAGRLRALVEAGHAVDAVYTVRPTAAISPTVLRGQAEAISAGEQAVADALRHLSETLAASGRPPVRLVIVDTVSASMDGSASDDATTAAYLRAVRRLLAVCPDAGVLLVHHPGWQDADTKRKRERGSSVWRGNVDAVFFAEAGPADERGDVPITVETLKTRDVARPAPLGLVRRVVALAGLVDVDGRPVSSCLVDVDPVSPADRRATMAAEAEARDAARIDVLARRVLRACAAGTVTSQKGVLEVRHADAVAAFRHAIREGWLEKPTKSGHGYAVTRLGIEAMR